MNSSKRVWNRRGKDLPGTIELVKVTIICEPGKRSREFLEQSAPLTLVETGNGLERTKTDEVENIDGGEIGSGCCRIEPGGDRGRVYRFPGGCFSTRITHSGALRVIEGVVCL